MKMDKLAVALRKINQSYGLDMTDLIILDDIAQKKKHNGQVTIMEIVETSSAASPATIHARIKRMCEHNIQLSRYCRDVLGRFPLRSRNSWC